MTSLPTAQPRQLSLYWLAVPALLMAVVVVVTLILDSVPPSPFMAQAITLDLVLTIPLAYWVVIRRTAVPQGTTVPVFVVGLLVAGAILPDADQALLRQIRTWVLPVVELAIVGFIVSKVRLFSQQVRSEEVSDNDVFNLLRKAASELMPARLAYALATELAVFYYLLLTWRRPRPERADFTSHRRSGTVALLGALVLMIVVEATAIHFILLQWSPIAAWVLTGVSAYTALQIAGMAKSLSRRFTSVGTQEIILRYGIMAEASIPLTQVASFGPSRQPVDPAAGGVELSPLSTFERPNFVIHLKDSLEMSGLYGIRRRFNSIAFFVDDPERLNDTLTAH